MSGVALENWEILPIGYSEIPIRPMQSGVTEAENTAVTPELTERQKTIFDLQKSLAKYSANSLEYKAIHQEINRLSRK